ncbi:NB-ARC domains-containing protein [Artemisia annua]|uniref:NB-ARC domains-containing protein n=1 Tax=Artemisia annua TaxID=35608 RepID=A0A2U1KML0_ARTAN|nr:NB-ARC domains-containing protein [Artemisia annua]
MLLDGAVSSTPETAASSQFQSGNTAAGIHVSNTFYSHTSTTAEPSDCSGHTSAHTNASHHFLASGAHSPSNTKDVCRRPFARASQPHNHLPVTPTEKGFTSVDNQVPCCHTMYPYTAAAAGPSNFSGAKSAERPVSHVFSASGANSQGNTSNVHRRLSTGTPYTHIQPPVTPIGESSTSAHNEDAVPAYDDIGDCDQRCRYCGAAFWYEKRLKGHYNNSRPEVNKLHPSYMSLQFPLLFIYGQPGYHTKLRVRSVDGSGKAKRVSMNAFYTYQLHPRPNQYDLIFRGEGGKSFESCVSVPTSKPGFLEFYERKDFRGINTQKSTLNSIIEAFKDENMQIIGIYGAGGVGKTTLAHEAAATVKNLFDDMVYIVVSENVDVENIKDMVNVAAKRVQEKDKILIILDDVRKEVNLSALGIPCGAEHMNCKILLTSRSKNVCEAMNTHSNICVKSLPEEEAWILFKRVVGEKVDASEKLKQIAMEAVDGCGGLPLIIQVVGNVLKKQRINLWEVTLAQLNNNVPSIVPLEMRGSFTHLKLSYDLLDSEEAKLCFLLCSMFPEREFIPLERLAHYCVGLGKLNRLRSMEDARKRVGIAVDNLKSLFLNGKDKFTTKMHDVVREVAHIIASEGKNIFLVEAGTGLSEWIPRKNDPNDYTGISLMQNNLCKLPDYVLHFPLLEILLIQENCKLSNITDEFIEAIKEVKVLDMEHNM